MNKIDAIAEGHDENRAQTKMAYFRRFWVKVEFRHSETISAKKRYTLIPLYRSTRHFRRFWVKEPRHSETISAKKRYTLIPLYRSTHLTSLRLFLQ